MMGGSVKAEAMAMKSLMKNSPRDVFGNGLGVLPSLMAYTRSFMRLQVVFTKNTVDSF